MIDLFVKGAMLLIYRVVMLMLAVVALITVVTLSIVRAMPAPKRIDVLHLTACIRPCWVGIRPGETTLDEAYQYIQGYFPESRFKISASLGGYTVQDSENPQTAFSVQFESSRSIISTITLLLNHLYVDGQWMPNNNTMLTFGELNALWGSPLYIAVWPCYGDWFPLYDQWDDTRVDVNPSDGYPDKTVRSSWNNPVNFIQMNIRTGEIPDVKHLRRWRGFLTYKEYGYQDGDPEYKRC